MRQKVCITIPTLHGAGCERMLSEVLPFYHRHFDVELVLTENKISYAIPTDLKVVVLDTPLGEGGLVQKAMTMLRCIRLLRKQIRTSGYSAIVSYLDGYSVMTYFANLGISPRIPQIAVEQTLDREFAAHTMMSSWKKKIMYAFVSYAYNRVRRVIAVSENVRTHLKDDLKVSTPISVIHNGIDPKRFNLDAVNKGDLDERFTGEGKKLLCISRLSAQKNIPYLIESFDLVRKTRSDVKLFILGTGPDREKIEALIKQHGLADDVILLGFDPRPENYLKASDVFVLSSRYESFGNVVVEALACGTPVVTANYGEVLREILIEPGLGEIVPQGNANKFAAAILRVLDEKFDRHKLHDFALQNFDASVKAQEYIRIVDEVSATRA